MPQSISRCTFLQGSQSWKNVGGPPAPPPCQAKNATVNNNVLQSHLTLGIHARLLREDPKQPQYIIPKWGQLD